MADKTLPMAGLLGGSILLYAGITNNRVIDVVTLRAQGLAVAGAASGSQDSGAAPGAATNGPHFPLPHDKAVAPSHWTQDQGVDIAAPGGTELIAMYDGVVVKNGISGFGGNAPVLQIAPNTFIYYGHAGPSAKAGTYVHGGSKIGEVGYGIVGISTGPHLEIGYCDKHGTPIKGTSGQMLSLLHTAYGS